MMRDVVGGLCVLSLFVAIALTVLVGNAVGQEPAAVPESATWASKLRTSIESGEAVVLTAEEAQALATAYTGIEQRQVADVAVSGTHCYALSSVGTVLAQAEVSR